MEVWFSVRAYNLYGGDRTLSLIGNVLAKCSQAAPQNLKSVEITAWFPTNRPAAKTLENLYEDFRQKVKELPATKYLAKKQKLYIDYRTSIGLAEDALQTYSLDHTRFALAFDELLDVVASVKQQLVRKKGLDAEALLEWLSIARTQAPTSPETLSDFENAEKARFAAERDQMSPWDLLGIDWDEFHPDARQVLDDPFFWEVADDYAPNGNDTGADLLLDVRESKGARLNPVRFLDDLLTRWGMKERVEVAIARFHDSSNADDEVAITTYDEAAIALPFALIKLYGSADVRAIQLGLDAIERERQMAEYRGWVIPVERLAALAKLEQKLRNVSAG